MRGMLSRQPRVGDAIGESGAGAHPAGRDLGRHRNGNTAARRLASEESVQTQGSFPPVFRPAPSVAKQPNVSATGNPNESPRVRWLVVIAVAAALAVAVVYWESGSAPEPTSQIPMAPPTAGERAASRAQRRLQELREAHQRSMEARQQQKGDSGSAPMAGGPLEVPGTGGQAGDTVRRLKPVPGSGGGAEAEGEAAPSDFDPDPDDIPALKQVALHDPDPDRRLTAVTLLGASDDPQAIPILAEALKDADEEVRLAAIQSLADMTEGVPVDLLGTAALSDPSPDNRYEALEALADAGGPAARPYIEKALQDPNEDVASLAESLLELDSDSSAERAAQEQK